MIPAKEFTDHYIKCYILYINIECYGGININLVIDTKSLDIFKEEHSDYELDYNMCGEYWLLDSIPMIDAILEKLEIKRYKIRVWHSFPSFVCCGVQPVIEIEQDLEEEITRQYKEIRAKKKENKKKVTEKQELEKIILNARLKKDIPLGVIERYNELTHIRQNYDRN